MIAFLNNREESRTKKNKTSSFINFQPEGSTFWLLFIIAF